MSPSRNDDDGAAYWAIRIDSGELSPSDQARMDAWIAADPRRSGLLLRSLAILTYLDRGRALTADGLNDSHAAVRRGSGSRRMIFAAAASLVLCTLAGSVAWQSAAPPVATSIGEVRKVPLEDGSRATLNTASRIAVSISQTGRSVQLEQGEAWFEVAKDKARPFVVAAGDVRVRAVGTAFSVRRSPAGAEILVSDGIVTTWVAGHERSSAAIHAGSVGLVSADRASIAVRLSPSDVERGLAWRFGVLALEGQTLGHAASELNRYNRRKLIVADPHLAAQKLVGRFKTSDPEKFARAIAVMTGAETVYRDKEIIMTSPDH